MKFDTKQFEETSAKLFLIFFIPFCMGHACNAIFYEYNLPLFSYHDYLCFYIGVAGFIRHCFPKRTKDN